MTTSLQLVRSKDGSVFYVGELPQAHVFAASFVMSGGIPAVMKEASDLQKAGRRYDHLNTEPIFTRDGNDILFAFPEGEVRYRFVGFEDDSEGNPNPNNWVFEKA